MMNNSDCKLLENKTCNCPRCSTPKYQPRHMYIVIFDGGIEGYHMTYSEALKHLQEIADDIDYDSSICDDVSKGGAYIAEVKAWTEYVPIQYKKDAEAAGDEWEYGDSEHIGRIKIFEVKDERN